MVHPLFPVRCLLLLVTHAGQVQVKEGQEEDFLEASTRPWLRSISLDFAMQASLQNARKSKGEPLNQRFDVLQQRAWASDRFGVG